jgi:hypothetical protein
VALYRPARQVVWRAAFPDGSAALMETTIP